jgi:hypothetical protein
MISLKDQQSQMLDSSRDLNSEGDSRQPPGEFSIGELQNEIKNKFANGGSKA